MGALACLSEKLKYILASFAGGCSTAPPSFGSSKEAESRQKDVRVNTLEPTETKLERIKREGRREQEGSSERGVDEERRKDGEGRFSLPIRVLSGL